MNDFHSNIAVLDATAFIGDLFIKLVSSIYHHGYKPIKIIVVRQFDIFMLFSGIEFGGGTHGFIPCVRIQSACEYCQAQAVANEVEECEQAVSNLRMKGVSSTSAVVSPTTIPFDTEAASM